MDLWWEGGGKRIMAVIRTMLGFNKSHDLRNLGLGEKKKLKKKGKKRDKYFCPDCQDMVNVPLCQVKDP